MTFHAHRHTVLVSLDIKHCKRTRASSCTECVTLTRHRSPNVVSVSSHNPQILPNIKFNLFYGHGDIMSPVMTTREGKVNPSEVLLRERLAQTKWKTHFISHNLLCNEWPHLFMIVYRLKVFHARVGSRFSSTDVVVVVVSSRPPLPPSYPSFRILLSTPLAVISYFLIWYVPPFENGKVIWYLFFYCLFQTLQTVSTPLVQAHSE